MKTQRNVTQPSAFPAPHIRWMIRLDMEEVLAIESASFDAAWTEEDFLRSLSQRNCIGMVVERGETVHGFMIYELYEHHLHLLNFAVDVRHRRCGLGSLMLERLKSKLSNQHRTRITANVRESNLAAQKFFAACGFIATGVERGFYDDTNEDAYRFEHRFATEAA